MKINIGGVGYSFYEVESTHEYAKEIAEGIHKGYERICSFSIPRIIRDMKLPQINEYLLFLFNDYERIFSADSAKEHLKNELMRVMNKCKSEQEIKTRDKLIKKRMKDFGSDDIIDYIISDVINKIKVANTTYEEKIKNAINISLYE